MSDLFQHLQRALADQFQLERELGRGGMATVYLAREVKHPRQVAIKVLRPELVGVLARERFLREIRISSEFTHPHILPLLDSGTVPASADFPALPFYTMPFIEGESLRARLTREKQLPVEDALAIAQDVAAALGYAHARGVVHRDIKPENILLTGGQAVVADFGIARAIQEAVDPDALTSAGLVIGTPAYMSPEQAGGETALDGRSDQYSLGCVLYEMLGGDPPFTGSSVQAVLARHRLDSAPSLSTVRQLVPPSIERAVMRSLAKSPADRFASATAFSAAMTATGTTTSTDVAPRLAARWARRILLGALAVTAIALGWQAMRGRGAVLSPNRVVVFPLRGQGTGLRPETGEEIALLIGSALEHTEPLRWIDGWTWLTPSQRGDVALLSATDARAIALRRGARYYVDGAVVNTADSSRVILRLNDAVGDSLLAQASASAGREEATIPQLALRATVMVLPSLLAPGSAIDLAPLSSRDPAAIADWLQGEREYRRARYASALRFQRRAVEADSGLAFAALKGALAAEWEHEYVEAADLVRLALAHDSILPTKYVHYARGLRAYYDGNADSSTAEINAALAIDSSWSEAWMTLGEIRYHLSTDDEAGASDAFLRAREADPEFAPPLFHLAEIAIRSGDTTGARRIVTTFAATDPDSAWLAELTLGLDCLSDGPDPAAWRQAAASHPLEALQAAKVLSSRGAHPACAEAGFRAVVNAADAPNTARWGAVLGLQGVLTAEGRLPEVKAVLEQAVASGVQSAKGLYVLHAAAGLGLDEQAAEVIEELGGDYRTMSVGRLWYHGIWLAHVGDQARLSEVASALSELSDSSNSRLTKSTARSIAARLALLQADTAKAIADLNAVVPLGKGAQIEWGMQEPFGQEQLMLAELLLARGQAAEALRVAGRLDHPRPIIYLVYLRQSLELRRKAAAGLGDTRAAEAYLARLNRLR